MSNEHDQKKRGRGRPVGSTNASKKLAQSLQGASPETAVVLNELAKANPSMPPAQISSRMSPHVWDAERRRMLLELLAEGDDSDCIRFFQENPKQFSPSGIEAYRISRDALDVLTAKRGSADVWLKEIEEGEAHLADLEKYNGNNAAWTVNFCESLKQTKETFRRLFEPKTEEELKSPERVSWLASVERGRKLLASLAAPAPAATPE